jgi:hypothetical protein
MNVFLCHYRKIVEYPIEHLVLNFKRTKVVSIIQVSYECSGDVSNLEDIDRLYATVREQKGRNLDIIGLSA